jgi:NAD(P)-dependent dehydrogenase (short-subunit alcohol dehydrogenase family)
MYQEKYSLDQRVAVVTGGGRNIGLACAHALAEAGAKVVIADIDEAVASEGLKQLSQLGYEAHAIRMTSRQPPKGLPRNTARSTSWCAMRASDEAASPRRRLKTSGGCRSSMSI